MEDGRGRGRGRGRARRGQGRGEAVGLEPVPQRRPGDAAAAAGPAPAVDRPGPAAAVGVADVPQQPHAPRPPVQQQEMAGPMPRMPAAVPPRMAEPGPQPIAVARPPAAGDGLGQPAPAAAAGVRAVGQGIQQLSLEGPGDAATLAAARGRDGQRRGALRYVGPDTRPAHVVNKQGSDGRQIQLRTNVFPVRMPEQYCLYQYHVYFNPEVPSTAIRKAMIAGNREHFGQFYMFDGMQLFLQARLERDETELFAVRRSDNENIRITIRLTAEVPRTSPTWFQISNIIFKRALGHLNLQMMNRTYVNPEQRVPLPEYKLEVWPGYDSSILQLERGAGLVVEVIHKMISIQTVYDVMNGIHQHRPANFREECMREIVGQIVITRYNNRTYRVDDINFDSRPTDTFQMRDGSQVTFVDYFQRAYEERGRITDLNQPLLLSQPKARDRRAGQEGPICLVPELCYTTGLSEHMRKDHRAMKAVSNHICLGPAQRVRRLIGLRQQIQQTDAARQLLEGWSMNISADPARIPARVLPPETVHQGQKKSYKVDERSAEWTKELRNIPLLTSRPLQDWICLYPSRSSADAQDFIAKTEQVSRGLGIQFTRPRIIELHDDRNASYIAALKDAVQPGITRIVVCVLSNNRKDRYDGLKTFLCCHNPVPSQMVLWNTLSKKNLSIVTKIVLQMECKMGGELWAVPIPVNKLMVIGIDTYHDTSKRGRSVAGFVASLNNTCTRYFTCAKFQQPGEELHNSLQTFMTNALRRYHGVNAELPKYVVVYRDGVGDGQVLTVLQHEVPQVRESLRSLAPECRLMYVVVKKRIAPRFFQLNEDGSVANPPPGTVIDNYVTRPNSFDFFVVSQSVNRGTVNPTCYDVIYDETQMPPNIVQRLTYKLCHLYYNYSGTIRVPAPCQYAHRIAYFSGESLHRDFDVSLADSLFYL